MQVFARLLELNLCAYLLDYAGDSKLTPEELQKVKKDRDNALKSKQDAARKLREEDKKRKLREDLDGEDESGSKKQKKGKKKKKKKAKLLSFDPDE